MEIRFELLYPVIHAVGEATYTFAKRKAVPVFPLNCYRLRTEIANKIPAGTCQNSDKLLPLRSSP